MNRKKKILFGLLVIMLVVPPIAMADGGSSISTGASGNTAGGGCNNFGNPRKICQLANPGNHWILYADIDPSFNNRQVILDQTNPDIVDSYFKQNFEQRGRCDSGQCLKTLKQVLLKFGISEDTESDNCERFNGHVYFAITAPISIGNVGPVYNWLVKEVAQRCTNGSYSCGVAPVKTGNFLRITGRTSDGINYYYNNTGGNARSLQQIADPRSGYGVFEAWVDKEKVCEPKIEVIEPPKIVEKCVQTKVRTAIDNPICSSTLPGIAIAKEEILGKNNSSVYQNQSTYTTDGSTYGIATKAIGEYCNIFCLEQASVTLPKGFLNPVVSGGNIVWPTSKNTKDAGRLNDKPLQLSGKKSCRVSIGIGSKQCSSVETNYNNMAEYTKKMAAERDYKMPKRTYEQVRNAIEKNKRRLAEPSDCDEFYAEALRTAKTDRRRQNVTNSITNCKYYIAQFNYVRLVTDKLYECDKYTKARVNNDLKSIYNYSVTGTVQNEDVEYNKAINLETETGIKYTTNFSCASGTNCWNSGNAKTKNDVKTVNDFYSRTQLKNLINHIESRKFNISTNQSSYKLPDGLYNYVNKRTNKASTTKPSNAPYSIVGYSNLPISYDAKTGVKVNVNMKDLKFGHNGKFRLNYTCPYEVTNSACVCPEGTLNAGQDLTCKLFDMSCIEAQETFCDLEIYDDRLICPDELERYKCKNTNNVGGRMDITSCVLTRRQQGSTLQQAIDYCDAVICPIGNRIPIIYRVISLENPFPGKNIANKVSGFNFTVTGRYPGANWNSQKLVNAQILNNRGVRSDSVYKKPPLYVFDLDSKTVQRIRAYNKQAADGYNDFTLECSKSTDMVKAGTHCVSKNFVHNSTYGLVGGACSNATGFDAFDSCAEK